MGIGHPQYKSSEKVASSVTNAQYSGVSQKCKWGILIFTFSQRMAATHQHSSRTMGWTIFRVDEKRNVLSIRSVSCQEHLAATDEASACTHCLSIPSSQSFRNIRRRAEEGAPANTGYEFLNAEQLRRIMQKQRTLINSLRTQVRRTNLFESYTRTHNL